ncbi:DUF3293 domain-containing protein [Vibrio sp. STUT-A11]|uniref:DUF3293 domain-containing protein n=1 Tax=Vibrio sp. STUT-A11 TaxID=2976236 RepID=UPI00222E2DEF|nr:DUF3293 domain-containing protein [Vibrio sp. STUT-A11]BDR14544.1 hypothetical protein VspSTUT11_25200 [Vibrio sp. STUT-A11]
MIEKNNTNIDASLWNAYANSFFRFETKWNVLTYVVITAWNPYSNLLSKEDNCIINQKLERRLKHVNYVPVTVGDSTFEWYEESFAAQISIEDAIALANEFQQNAIYYVSHGDLYLIACSDLSSRHKVAKMSERLV